MKNSRWYSEGFNCGNQLPGDACECKSPYAHRSPKDLIWHEGFKDGVKRYKEDNKPPTVDTPPADV